MAKYRHVYCKFWNDPEVLEYTPEDRYFYLYLITNEHSTQCGIYEISKKVIAFETGYNQDTVENLINRFEKRNKIEYDRETNEIAILNWSKYNLQNTGKPILDCIRKELKDIKSKELIRKMSSTIDKEKIKALYNSKLDGASTQGGTQGRQKEKEKEKEKQKENNKPSDKSDTEKGDKFSIQEQTDSRYYIYPDEYEELYEIYPANNGSKKAGWRKWAATRRKGVSKKELMLATKNYAKVCKEEGREKKYVKYIGTFFGPDEHWKEYLDLNNKDINSNKKGYRKAADF